MNKQTGLPGRKASWNKRTDTPLTPMKRPSLKPSPRKKWKQQHPNYNQSDSLHKLNRTEQVILFRLRTDTTDLTPTCTKSSRLASLRCAHATQTSWLQNIFCSTVDYMMLWGRTHGRNRRYWGTSFMATWRSLEGQPPSWRQQAWECMCVCARARVCVWVSVCMSACMCVCARACVCMCVCVHVCAHGFVCLCVCQSSLMINIL